MTDIAALSKGFRDRFLSYDELTEQVHAWAKAMPGVVRLESIAKSEQGRDLWLLTIGPDPDRIRPAAWLDGNIHAGELAGSSVCLSIAEDLIRAHAGDPLVDLPPHLRELLLADVLFYILPRMCPDGAERVLEKRHFVRSNFRDHRMANRGPYWRNDDVDGDGLVHLMRIEDETGDFVESKQVEGLMLPRELEDVGPFYRVYPEGFIERWDGFTIPRPSYMSDSQTDMNRNFPSTWRAEPKQLGAGAFPTSEPESRGVTEFAVKHPNIFVWLCMHTFGGVYIRPMNDKVDIKMDPFDQAVFRQIERWGDKIVGYPTVSGFMEFTYEPETPLYGELANYAYVERGAIGFVCELWDFFKQVGFEVKRPFSKNYDEHTSREALEKIATWDRDHNQGRIVGKWKKVVHPQLGDVEVGGYDPLVGVQNPPLEKLAGICADQSRFFLRVASMTPRLTIASIEQQRIGDGLVRVIAIVENRGWLPTYFLGSAQSMPESDPVRVALDLAEGTMLVSGDREVAVGSIVGWGGNDRGTSPMMARTANEQARRKVEWVVRGEGEITITARNTRVGVVAKTVKVPR